jgi:putative hydrolase of the HAD superfamily
MIVLLCKGYMMKMSKRNYRAIIFDLFGTLVNNYSIQQREHVLSIMASLLCIPCDPFMHMWNKDTWHKRATGVFASIEENILYICQILDIPVETNQLLSAAQTWIAFKLQELKPLPGALEVLSALKGANYKIGLISDCSCEIPLHWGSTPFASLIDDPVFSCSIGLKKPDPQIYSLACERLAVQPHECLYVGDGSSYELMGAALSGMYPVCIQATFLNNPDAYRPDAENWQGQTIIGLNEVLTLLSLTV